ncbi:MAG: DUF115 domain-containing protein [Spirochaetaceae bacterium]|jgi:hypothetical protein|nr:DUF115 domain-containing protein [Spirochaetaceae bacterium]
MDKHIFFERNLLALSRGNPALCTRLSGAETTLGRYRFVESSRAGREIPAWVDSGGAAYTLHSLVSPEREAERLASTVKHERYVVIMGLGAGYTAEAILASDDTAYLLAIEYDIDGLAELLCHYDYIKIFNDPRFFIIVDPKPPEIENHILATFQPALHNGIRTLPLRARTSHDESRFVSAAGALRSAIDKVASDYSVQALFGKRWFSNIIRNIFTAEKQCGVFAPVKHAAICAAGPSLDLQLGIIAKKRKTFFLISTDTALSTLLEAGLPPDAVISIDCQHISYRHFMKRLPPDIPLFLDLSSPPLLTALVKTPFFFSGGHPLSTYVTRFFRHFPVIDTSGANVTFAALSLAERLGASVVELYGADFSYPKGKLYTRPAYLYPYFHRKQNRFSPAENLAASFLYNSKSLRRVENASSWYYETRALSMYREKFEEKVLSAGIRLNTAPGEGAPVKFSAAACRDNPDLIFEMNTPVQLLAAGSPVCGAKEFLETYRREISELPSPEENITVYQRKLSGTQYLVFTTLLPALAAIKYRRADLGVKELLSAAKNYCASEIHNVNAAHPG